ncbi:hypothetical protein ACSNO4_01835 [Kocuria flava]|uniref:hypothetical protein n=1 Tax=Kocuria flava TaxID=446860 RepID=UPI003F1D68A2
MTAGPGRTAGPADHGPTRSSTGRTPPTMHTDPTAAPPAPRARDAPAVRTYTEARLDKFAYHRAIKRARDLTPAQKCALYAAWDYADAADGTFFLGAATLSADMGYKDKDHKTAKRLLTSLQDKGYLVLVRQGGTVHQGPRLANAYELALPIVAASTTSEESDVVEHPGGNTTPGPGGNTTPGPGGNTTPPIDPELDPVLDPRDTPLACSTPTAPPSASRAVENKPPRTTRPSSARTPHQLILDAMQDAARDNDGFPDATLIARVRDRHGGDVAEHLSEGQWTLPRDLAPHGDSEADRRDRAARARAGTKLRTFLNTCRLEGIDVRNHPDDVDPYPERPLHVLTRAELEPAH